MRFLNSIDIGFVLKEMQRIVNWQIKDINGLDQGISIDIESQGRNLSLMITRKALWLTRKKSDRKTNEFSSSILKLLKEAEIRRIYMHDSGIVGVIETDKGSIITEFFQKGNIIITDLDGIIRNILNPQIWYDRSLFPGDVYKFPDLDTIIRPRNEKTGTVLRQRFGLYAMEILSRTKIKPGSVFDSGNCIIVRKAVYSIINSDPKPHVIFDNRRLQDFSFIVPKTEKRILNFKTTSEALDYFNSVYKKTEEGKIEEERITAAHKINSAKFYDSKIAEESFKLEFIENNRKRIKNLIDEINTLREIRFIDVNNFFKDNELFIELNSNRLTMNFGNVEADFMISNDTNSNIKNIEHRKNFFLNKRNNMDKQIGNIMTVIGRKIKSNNFKSVFNTSDGFQVSYDEISNGLDMRAYNGKHINLETFEGLITKQAIKEAAQFAACMSPAWKSSEKVKVHFKKDDDLDMVEVNPAMGCSFFEGSVIVEPAETVSKKTSKYIRIVPGAESPDKISEKIKEELVKNASLIEKRSILKYPLNKIQKMIPGNSKIII